MEKREYRSAVRSRRLIREAFRQLLQEKPFEKITVTDIVKRADINRSTFYAHYQDIWALVEEYQQAVMQNTIQLTKRMSYSNLYTDLLPFLREVTRPLAENRDLYRQLTRTNYAQQQVEAIKRTLTELTLQSPQLSEQLRSNHSFRLRIEFIMSGIFGVYLQWLQGEVDCTIDEVSEEIARIIQDSAQNILNASFAE